MMEITFKNVLCGADMVRVMGKLGNPWEIYIHNLLQKMKGIIIMIISGTFF